tara:strand:+ start:3539 stop:5185 length:1647 start_codon:yes stop_codon:yes gene_type:complete
MSISVVRKTLLTSGISLKSINSTVTNFSSSVIESNKLASSMVKRTREDNKFIRKVISNEESFFVRRRESVIRKEREGVIEAGKVGGAVRYSGTVTTDSTKGFLGRMLDFTAVLLTGWLIKNGKQIGEGGEGLTDNMLKLSNTAKNYIDSQLESFTSFGDSLEKIEGQTKGFDITEEQSSLQKEQESISDSTFSIFSSITESLNQLYDDKFTGLDFFKDIDEKLKNNKSPKDKKENSDSYSKKQKEEPKKQKEEPAKIKKEDKDPIAETIEKANSNKEKVEKEKTTKVVQNVKKEVREDQREEKEKQQKAPKDFESGYVPEKEIFYKDENKKTRSKINPEWVAYQEWLNAPGGLDMFADGGRPIVGKPSIVGEKGPELFVADKPGTIIPNNTLNSGSFFNKTITRSGTSKDEVRQRRMDRSKYEKAVENLKEKQNGVIYHDQDEALKEQYMFAPRNARKNNTSSPSPKEIKPIIDGVQSSESIQVMKKPSVSETIRKERTGPVIMLPSTSGTQSQSSPAAPAPQPIEFPEAVGGVNIINIIQDLELSYT